MTLPTDQLTGENASHGSSIAASPQRMQCMEVWGGNRSTSAAFDMPGLRVHVYSRPHADADSGGDVYYMSSCASGRVSRLLLADVCGHGAAVSDTATRLRRLMRKNINFISQKRLTNGVNQEFSELSVGGRFATALISSYFSPTSTLTVCNAGHPQPLIYRAKQRTWSIHEQRRRASEAVGNLPLGIDEQTNFEEFATSLAAGDMLLCYTDALSEAPTESGMLGVQGLLQLVQQTDADRPQDLISSVLNAVTAASPAALEKDDVTIMLIECTDTTVRLRDNLAAPFRFLKSVVKSFFSRT